MRIKIVLVSVLVLMALCQTASATWWDSSWDYRTYTLSDISNVPAGGGVYRVNLHYGYGTNSAGNIYCGYHVKDYFDDVRFVMGDGTECNYWIDWKTYPPAVASVVVPQNGTLYIYYDNPSASAGVTTIHNASINYVYDTSLHAFATYEEVTDEHIHSISPCPVEYYHYTLLNDYEYEAYHFTSGGPGYVYIYFGGTQVWYDYDFNNDGMQHGSGYTYVYPTSPVKCKVRAVSYIAVDADVVNYSIYCYQKPFVSSISSVDEERQYGYPYVTSYSPDSVLEFYTNDSQTFSVDLVWTVSGSCTTTWYIDNSSVYVNPYTVTSTRTYTNESLQPGLYNFTVIADTGIGTAMKEWSVLVHPRTYIPDDYATIQSAINVLCITNPTDSILVRDGTYTENIVLPTGCDNLTIISENGSASTIIEAAVGSSPTISFSSNDNTTIQGFTIKDGTYGIAIDSGSSNTTLSNNLLTTNFNAGLYITGSHPDLSIVNTTSSYNQDGAILYACEQATISDLDCTYNYDSGIELQNSDHNTLDSCTIAYNADNGIELISSSDFNTILNNTIEYNNNYGLVIMSGSDYNKIYNNKFTNGANGYDEALNTWYTTLSENVNIIGGQYTGGNYYSDYSGDDDDHDGIGDTPYEITGGAIDMLPLSGVGMWVVFDAPSHLIGESVTVIYHLTDSSFGTYNYFIEVRDELNTLLETWSLSYGEDSGSYDFTLNYGWQTGEYDVYLWRTPKAGGGEVLLSQDTMTVGERMVITGTVYDVENNITLDGVSVTFDQLGTEYTDTTAGGGTYELETLDVDKLTWINVSKDGYTHDNFTITLLAAMAYEIDLYLLPVEPYRYGNAIGGIVTSYPFHQAIESATVDLSNATWSDTYTTNAFGFYSFHNMTSGSYDITASKAGYSTYTPDTVSI